MLFKITCINSISMPLQEPLVLGIRWHLRAPSLSRFPEVTGWSLNAWVAFAIELNTTLVWLPNKHSNCVRVLKSVDKYFKEVKLPPHAVSHPAGRLYPTTSTILCHEFYNELNINYVNHAKSQDTSESRSLVLRWIQVILDAIVWAITVVVTTASPLEGRQILNQGSRMPSRATRQNGSATGSPGMQVTRSSSRRSMQTSNCRSNYSK